MKDEIPLNEIKLFSIRPDQVGYETLISTIERLLEMAISRINEQEGGEDYRRGLLMTAVSSARCEIHLTGPFGPRLTELAEKAEAGLLSPDAIQILRDGLDGLEALKIEEAAAKAPPDVPKPFGPIEEAPRKPGRPKAVER